MPALSGSDSNSKDHWNTEAYSKSASFVPQLTKTVVQYLDAKPTERILDVGCGDGKFTNNFLHHAGYVLGVDASHSLVESATRDFGSDKVKFRVVDCRELDKETDVVNGTWDKVVSNAALHWILKDETTRLGVLQAVHNSLKSGGTFVFEMGAAGNCPEIHTALLAAFTHQGGGTIREARKASPWFFPSESWMRTTLENIGFRVDKLEVEHRPTKLTTDEGGGIQGWVRLMGAAVLEKVPEERRDAFVREACDLVESIITREDGSKWLGYIRLRGVAVKI